MNERDAGGRFVIECTDPRCTGRHSGNVPVAERCPAATERKIQRRHEQRAASLDHYRKRDRESKRRERGTAVSDLTLALEAGGEDVSNEVLIAPGRCVVWTAKQGHCLNHADELVCEQHAKAFVKDDRPSYFRAEDYPEYASMSRVQRESFRKAVAKRNKREALGLVVKPTSRERATSALNRGTEKIMLRAADKRAKRRSFVMAKLDECGFVSTADVANEFGISPDTVKSVLCDLAEEGVVERVYGGAKLPGVEVKGSTLRRPRENP